MAEYHNGPFCSRQLEFPSLAPKYAAGATDSVAPRTRSWIPQPEVCPPCPPSDPKLFGNAALGMRRRMSQILRGTRETHRAIGNDPWHPLALADSIGSERNPAPSDTHRERRPLSLPGEAPWPPDKSLGPPPGIVRDSLCGAVAACWAGSGRRASNGGPVVPGSVNSGSSRRTQRPPASS